MRYLYTQIEPFFTNNSCIKWIVKEFHMRKVIFIASILFFLITACTNNIDNNRTDRQKLDYSKKELWYTGKDKATEDIDVFYVLPTCVWNWNDSLGNTHFYADPYNSTQREAMRSSYELAENIFGGLTNFYAPYYGQITLEQWMEGDALVEQRFPKAMYDIKNAFNYFIRHMNNNRPFIVAGFSQGGKAVAELLKTMPKELCDRMIAAYVIGYRITNDELNKYNNIKAATNANDIGVTICYNSVDAVENICPVLSPSAICINPINWKTDATPAMLNDRVSVRIDIKNKVLIVDGLDSKQYYLPILDKLFKEGNYHLQELSFYKNHLKDNIKNRIKAYKRNQN